MALHAKLRAYAEMLNSSTLAEAAERLETLERERDEWLTADDYYMWMERAEAAEAEVAKLRKALDWYEAHKVADGSYDGGLFGDLTALSADAPEGQT